MTKQNQIREQLNERERDLLYSLKLCRFLRTNQLQKLHFLSTSAGLRATTRTLTKLKKLRLIGSLKRRIGGVRAGSSSTVWTLKSAGAALIGVQKNRLREPSTMFLQHTLAVADCFVHLKTREQLKTVQFEPFCWRRSGAIKPDLYAVTEENGYENHRFFELDLDTEAPSRVVKKCELYGQYFLTGAEQERNGVFPKVVWIVPDLKRKSTILRHVGEKCPTYAPLFEVVVFEDFLA